MKISVAGGSGAARIAGWRPSRLGITFEGIAIRLAGAELRVPNIMKHVCVAGKIGSDAKGGAEHIANMVKLADKVSSSFGRNSSGWREFWPMALSLPLPIFAILAAGRFAP